MIDVKATNEYVTSNGENVLELSDQGPVLLIFLRHFGCIFCREALKDISEKRESMEKKGIKIVFVHNSTPETGEEYFEKFNLSGISHISDPSTSLYRSFSLGKGNFSQLFGLKNWVRGFEVTVEGGIPFSLRQIGDGFQMPGIFLISKGEIKESYIHKSAADKPDYDNIISCCAA